jgi:hypothetical protein
VAEVMQGKDPRHPDGCLYNPPPITDRKIDTLTNNPLIRHRLLLAERLYGSLIHHYAQGDLSRVGTVVIETTRELSEFSGKTNEEISTIITKREKHHTLAKKHLEENRGPKGLQYAVSSSLIRKWRIAMDTNRTCPYTGEKYDLRQIVDGEVEIEHVIPRSKRESDSLNGLVLTSPEVNGWKDNLTGYAFIKKFEGQTVPEKPTSKLLSLEQYKKLVQALPGPETTAPLPRHRKLTDDEARQLSRKRFLLLESYDKRDSAFTEGALSITAYLNRLVEGRLKNLYGKRKEKPHFIPVRGIVTGVVRRNWKLMETLGQANPLVLDEEGKPKLKADIREISHLHHALDASVAALAATLFPQDDFFWQLMRKRHLNEQEARRLRENPNVQVDAKGRPSFNPLPPGLVANISERLAERRVRQHMPARIGGFFPNEKEYGSDSDNIDESTQKAILHRSGKKTHPISLDNIIGLSPRGEGKLASRRSALYCKEFFGVWLGDPPEVIPMVFAWQHLQRLRKKNPNTLVLRKGNLIELAEGHYKGMWQVVSFVECSQNGLLVKIFPVDSVPSSVLKKSGGKRPKINVLISSGLRILPRALI